MIERRIWIENTNLVREWLEMKQEIQRHKWIESEKSGRDIGWDRAFINWMMNHRRDFISSGPSAPRRTHSLPT